VKANEARKKLIEHIKTKHENTKKVFPMLTKEGKQAILERGRVIDALEHER
jgi:hypothetical protein